MSWLAPTICLREGEQLSELEQLLEDVRPLAEFWTKEEASYLAQMAKGRMVLEVGTWKGCSAILMARGGALHVDAVDPQRGGQGLPEEGALEECWANLKRYGVRDKVTLHVGGSERLLSMFYGRVWDLVLIDGDHDRCRADTHDAVELLDRGGVIVWHDMGAWKVDEGPAYVANVLGWRIERPAGSLAVAYSA